VPLKRRQIAAAVDGCERALSVAQTYYGRDNPILSAHVDALATAYYLADRYGDAEAMRQRNLGLIRRLYGEQSLLVVGELINLSSIQGALQRDAEARATLERALAIVDGLGVPAQRQRMVVLIELAVVVAAAGELSTAIEHAEGALALANRLLSPDDPDLAMLLLRHAETLRRDPDHRARALASLQRAAAILERNDPTNNLLGGVLATTAMTLIDLGRPREAIPDAERALTILRTSGSRVYQAYAQSILGQALLHGGSRARGRREILAARAIYVELGASADIAELDRLLGGRERRAQP
jgi:tetratricopeptide (TPR) repeat protein